MFGVYCLLSSHEIRNFPSHRLIPSHTADEALYVPNSGKQELESCLVLHLALNVFLTGRKRL